MSELEIAQSQIVQLTTQCVLLRGDIVTLKEKLAAARRELVDLKSDSIDPGDIECAADDRTQAEIDAEAKGEHDADLERSGH